MPRIRTRLSLAAAAVATALAAAALTGCSPAADAVAPSAAPADGFPVTIADAFGDTTIEKAPTRVATWGWGAADAVLALGMVPVAIPTQSYGGDKDGVLPWIADALKKLDAKTPTMLDQSTNEVPVQAVAAAKPDVFLAPYSGLTKEEHDQLTALGIPVVAYPDKPWATPWRDVIRIVGEALGKKAEAEKVVDGIDATIAQKAKEHPEFQGVTIAQGWDGAGTYSVYLPADARVQFVKDLGFTIAPSVAALDTGESTFYTTVSYENLDKLTSDVLLEYADDKSQMDAFLASSQATLLPQVAKGAVAQVYGPAKVSSVSPPTALSLTWGIDDLVDELAKAVAAAKK